jgi:hypothetical protein
MNTTLGIQIDSRQLGYAVFEGGALIDWGIKDLRLRKKRMTAGTALPLFGKLIDQYQPDVVVLPTRTRNPNSARSRFLEAIKLELARSTYKPVIYGRREIREALGPLIKAKSPSKYPIMKALVGWFPELQGVLPKPRRRWDPEPYWTPVFDAVSLAATYLSKQL